MEMTSSVSITERAVAKNLRGASVIGMAHVETITKDNGYVEWVYIVAWERDDQCGTHRVNVNSLEESMCLSGHYDMNRDDAIADMLDRANVEKRSLRKAQPTTPDEQQVEFFNCGTTTEGFDENVRWQPFIDHNEGRVGYKATRLSDGAETFIYLNPSESGDDGEPDVFIYSGDTNDPVFDAPLHFYTPDFDYRGRG